MKISTKTGDFTTTAVKGGRISKASIRVDAYGSIDELLSLIGFVHFYVDEEYKDQLNIIMDNLRIIIKELANTTSLCLLEQKNLEELENTNDILKENCQNIKLFQRVIGNIPYLHINHTRTVTRRVERKVVLLAEHESVNQITLSYLNRLSDYFFLLSQIYNN
ncbi:cob(I)yrinic acid a,c-diamide adenosyltransferase [Mycoplasma sp. P36-A1]|uniref:cob(I)yrinic acid a,c-diamide adenosyltransferase n=1 Tax=Mycoplasma sp. P36-A1 TaxID=3252900 RepID=UPI003C2F77A2